MQPDRQRPIAISALMRREIGEIDKLFAAHRIRAAAGAPGTMAIRTSYIRYAVELARDERIEKIEKIVREIAGVLRRLRDESGVTDERRKMDLPEEVTVTVTTQPLSIIVPHPWPASLAYCYADLRKARPLTVPIGHSYDAAAPRVEYLDLARQYHTLIVAQSGRGKSNLLNLIVGQLMHQNSPDRLAVIAVDLKRVDLAVYEHAPHVIAYADDIPTAEAAIRMAYDEMERRKAGAPCDRCLLVAVDELADITASKTADEMLAKIGRQGRSFNVRTIAASQRATTQSIGSMAPLFTDRLVGGVVGATAAAIAAQRPDTGAELLTTPGEFIYIAGPTMRRLKAYHFGADMARGMAAEICERWGERRAAPPAAALAIPGAPATAEQPAPATAARPDRRPDPIPAEVRAVFDTYADPAAQRLARGGMAAAMRVLHDGVVPAGATFQRSQRQIDTYLLTYFGELAQAQHTERRQRPGVM